MIGRAGAHRLIAVLVVGDAVLGGVALALARPIDRGDRPVGVVTAPSVVPPASVAATAVDVAPPSATVATAPAPAPLPSTTVATPSIAARPPRLSPTLPRALADVPSTVAATLPSTTLAPTTTGAAPGR